MLLQAFGYTFSNEKTLKDPFTRRFLYNSIQNILDIEA